MNEFERDGFEFIENENEMVTETEVVEEYIEKEELLPVEPEFSENSDIITETEETEILPDEEQPVNEETEETDEKKSFFCEIIKKKDYRKYVAIAVAAAILNMAALGGLFAAGYSLGSGKIGAVNKSNVLSVLSQDNKKPVTENASPAVSKGAELSTVDISKKVGPSVVGITSKVQNTMSIFNMSAVSEGTGSGIIISGDGYIVTNNHVIEGAMEVSVTLNTGSVYAAKLIGSDSRTDLAVLKISPDEELTVAELGDSSEIEVGERAVAIGNPLGMEFFGSTTQGIISAINRTITVDNRTMSVIQTDAAINEGNSGGALVNAYGQVIGINAVKISSSTVEGMGFAIPISEAKPVIEDLIKYGYVKGRPVIGISSRDVTEYMANRQGWPVGVQVMAAQAGSGADLAGLEQGDIITKADDKKVATTDELNKVKNSHKPGEVLKLEVYKYQTGLTTTVSIKLTEERPN